MAILQESKTYVNRELRRSSRLSGAMCLPGGHSVVCSRPVQNLSILFLMLLHLKV